MSPWLPRQTFGDGSGQSFEGLLGRQRRSPWSSILFSQRRSTINALNTLRASITPNQKVGILTLDIRNAYNSVPWAAISKALREKVVSGYLPHFLDIYLEDRPLSFEEGLNSTKIVVTCGVPQGSVLDSTLWNILYDGLLRTRLPAGVEYLAFADDVSWVARTRDSIQLERLHMTSAQTVNDCLKRTA